MEQAGEGKCGMMQGLLGGSGGLVSRNYDNNGGIWGYYMADRGCTILT